MQHSEKLKIRNKILSLKYNVSRKQTEELHFGKMDSAFELYDLKKCLDFVLHVFDDVNKLETTKLEEINTNIIYNKKMSNNALRTLKLVKIKYKLK
jgi:hypothetical protein